MVLLTCKCLNITANVSGDVAARKVVREDVPVCKATSALLNECIGPFAKSAELRIETKHEDLTTSTRIQETPNSSTVLFTCIVCDQIVYGVLEGVSDNPAVVFNGSLVSSLEAISAMKMDESYSKTFKIIIRQPQLLPSVHVQNALDSPDPRLKSLSSLLNERLHKETERVEENIRRLTAQQFDALQDFRQEAEHEFAQLAQRVKACGTPASLPPNKLLLSEKKSISVSVVGGNLLETPPLTPDSGMTSSPPRLGAGVRSNSLTTTTAKVPPSGRLSAIGNQINSFESGPVEEEEFFGVDVFFPGTVETGTPASEFEDDSDDDDATDRYRLASTDLNMTIAKSLPMATPIMQNRVSHEETTEGSGNYVDIAASIKHLARSVHSDAIFGDLPRPRLNTQI